MSEEIIGLSKPFTMGRGGCGGGRAGQRNVRRLTILLQAERLKLTAVPELVILSQLSVPLSFPGLQGHYKLELQSDQNFTYALVRLL